MSAFDDLEQNVSDLQTEADDHENRLETIEQTFTDGLRAQLDFPMDPQTVQQIQGLFPASSVALAAGTATVVDGRIAPSSQIIYSRATAGGTVGQLSISSQSSGSFTLSSSSGTETSTINYVIFNPYVS